MFHLDEYIGLSVAHPASFVKYLQERFLARVSELKAAYLINGERDPIEECRRLGVLIREHPIDIALVGIGENGHLAFNDPPADFETDEPYIIVKLDEACRRHSHREAGAPLSRRREGDTRRRMAEFQSLSLRRELAAQRPAAADREGEDRSVPGALLFH